MKLMNSLLLVLMVTSIFLLNSPLPLTVTEAEAAVPEAVAYWPMNEGNGNISDTVGGLVGAVEATWIDGELDFDGTDDRVTLADVLAGSPAAITAGTISAQIFPRAYASGNNLWTMDGIISDAAGYYSMGFDDTGKIVVFVWDGAVDEGDYTRSSGSIPLNRWSQVVYTWDGSGSHIYINGEPDGTGDNDHVDSHADNGMYFATGYHGDKGFFNGRIAEVGFWDRTLSENEVELLFLDEPVHYWPMNEGSGNISDTVGGLVGAVEAPWIDGELDFDGTDDRVLLADVLAGSPAAITAGTISAQIFPRAYASGNNLWTMDGIISDAAGYYSMGFDDTGKIVVFVWDGAVDEGDYTRSSGSIPLNRWSQVVYTWDGSGSHIYINGEPDGTGDNDHVDSHADNGMYFATGYHGDKGFFNGRIAEVGFWDRALSENEIVELYSEKVSIQAEVPSYEDPGSWLATHTNTFVTAAQDSKFLFHPYGEADRTPAIIGFPGSEWAGVSAVSSVTLAFIWASDSVATVQVEAFVDGTWQTVISGYDPPGGLTFEKKSFSITHLSDWSTSDLENLYIRLTKGTDIHAFFIDSIELEVCYECLNEEQDIGWNTYDHIPREEADFEHLGRWAANPQDSISISSCALKDGMPVSGQERSLRVSSQSVSQVVEIKRAIHWGGILEIAEGVKITVSAFYTSLDSGGTIRLGVKWIYGSRDQGNTEMMIELDWSPRYSLARPENFDQWVQMSFVADCSLVRDESDLKAVELIIQLDSGYPSASPTAYIDRLMLGVTEGHSHSGDDYELLDRGREFQSNVLINYIDPIDVDGIDYGLVNLALSFSVNTGEWENLGLGEFRYYTVDYMTVSITPSGATPFDQTSLGSLEMAAHNGGDLGPLWDHLAGITNTYTAIGRFAEESLSWYFVGRLGLTSEEAARGEFIDAVELFYNFITGTVEELTSKRPWSSGDCTGSFGNNPVTTTIDVYEKLGQWGSQGLEKFQASIPAGNFFRYKADDGPVSLNINIRIGWIEWHCSIDSETGLEILTPIGYTPSTHDYPIELPYIGST
ncbi:MAG: LamG domain-containing protein [Candidatus Odinarchaeota archaeon]